MSRQMRNIVKSGGRKSQTVDDMLLLRCCLLLLPSTQTVLCILSDVSIRVRGAQSMQRFIAAYLPSLHFAKAACLPHTFDMDSQVASAMMRQRQAIASRQAEDLAAAKSEARGRIIRLVGGICVRTYSVLSADDDAAHRPGHSPAGLHLHRSHTRGYPAPGSQLCLVCLSLLYPG